MHSLARGTLAEILSYLDPKDLILARKTSKIFHVQSPYINAQLKDIETAKKFFTARRNPRKKKTSVAAKHFHMNAGLLHFAFYGKLYWVKYFIEQGANRFANAVTNAIQGKQWHIIAYLHQLYNFDKCESFRMALKNNNLKLIQFLIESCSYGVDWAFIELCSYEQAIVPEIENYIINKLIEQA